jgi:ribulose bisphosphate carboxylase small subunit
MPTILGNPVEPHWRGIPPHMSTLDENIWRRFREGYWKKWKAVYYDVRVGEMGQVPEQEEEKMKEMWRALTMVRIDAVVEKENEVEIIEVRPNAGRSALGACITYRQLWSEDPKLEKQFCAAVVTDNITPQFKRLFELFQIRVYVV